MGAVVDVRSSKDLQAAIANDKPIVLHFWARWCEPCSHMDSVLTQLASDLPGITCARVEAEVVDELTVKFDVTTVPYFVFLRSGEVSDRLEGADPPALTAKATALARTGAATSTSTPPAPAPPPPPAVTAATGGAAPAAAPAPAADPGSSAAVFGRIKYLLSSWPVVVFMKGVAEAPRCGFSGRVVEALRKLGVAFKSVDILQDEAIRQGLKEYSNWPTYPQLYVKGELVGGCDIVTEMAASGELEALLREKLGADFRGVAAAAVAGAAGTAPPPPTSTSAPPPPAATTTNPAAAAAPESSEAVRERIRSLLGGPQPVMLFMKGTPDAPRCGFSRRVVEALKAEGVEFGSFDILQDEAIRQGLKEYSNWPTYPQLYVRGELVGGCDIVTEMRAAGELGSSINEMLHRMDVA
ncbi:hypothetical protein Agub_g2646 [Astrephomene gubernaculifera]|uniref:Thioredoxin domain-containing protein n=1 Tax=Astrephomene gubernaculifera TaxID=47775 RepID=A0AAD3DHE7_9CHLO|nr:hypothetical protein Agub_g2646 [Astrephomene gubernaculifera]